MMNVTERLTHLQNRATRYEVVLVNGSTRMLLGYTARTGRNGMIPVAQNHGETICSMVGEGEFGAFVGAGTKCVWTLANGWTIRFGRTEGSAIVEGELSSITSSNA
jgi:hypothetical protein